MKNKIITLFVLLIGILLPLNIASAAKKYNSLNFRETLAEEAIEEKFTNYEENDDQITIYLFRGRGCGYCRAFLEFMNSITDEYGKYFKLKTYEVWNDANNADLMVEVSNYLEQPAGGVPYIIIGDKVFAGYAEDYNEGIKQAIVDLYNTKKNKRYDVFKKMHSIWNFKISETGWNLIFVVVASVIVISYINLKFKELHKTLEELKNNHTSEVKEVKKSTPKKVAPKEKNNK